MSIDELRHKVARQVCGKKEDLLFTDCYQLRSPGNAPCSTYGKCRIEEKSESQLEYILSDRSENIFLKACPGSGKTEVVALKAAREMRSWDGSPGGIAVLTFTNNAADVISERVNQCVGVNKTLFPHFIGTFDSWLHGYLGHPFFHEISKYEGQDGDHSIRVIDSNSNSGFLNSFSTKYGYSQTGNPLANQYFLDLEQKHFIFSSGNRPVDAGRNNIELKDYQVTDLRDTKARFAKGGFATYQDVENDCYYSLNNADLCARFSKRFPFIIVDECQDLSWIQMQILKFLMDAGSSVHFVGDLNQAIYGFKEVAPEKVNSFASANSFKQMLLLDNFRSNQQIVDVCQKLVSGDVVSGRDCDDENRCLYVVYGDDEISSMPGRFEQLLEERGVEKSKAVILARGRSTLSKLRPSGSNTVDKDQLRLAMALYLWGEGGTQSRDDSLSYLGRFISVKYFGKESARTGSYYCPESVQSHLRWRLFLAAVLGECTTMNEGAMLEFSLLWKDWAKLIRDKFHLAVNSCKEQLEYGLPDFPSLSGNFRALSGSSNQSVESSLPVTTATVSEIRTTTIHSVKGETHDAVMLVSSPTASGAVGGCWKEWLNDPQSEHARFAYVASSRPENLLVWAVPSPSDKEKMEIERLGFKPAVEE